MLAPRWTYSVSYTTAWVPIVLLCYFVGVYTDSEFFSKGKICIGTNGRMSVPSNREHHYRNLRDRYTNCTYVDGNLELTWLQDENVDLSFLHNIREVTGYVLISHVDVKKIVLPKLQIIRGRTLFKVQAQAETFALIVTLCKTFSLEMPSLRDILNGSVGMLDNYNICHVKTINWEEIITDIKGKFKFEYNFPSLPERECRCDPSCEAGCWGEGPENCQKFSKVNCSPQCFQGRCFGPKPRECCHLFCAGGCTGPKQSDCLACRNFYDDGVCTSECPPMQRYNPITYSWESNQNGKYAYGATCVKNCPEHLLKDNGACVRSCPPTKQAVNGECVPCVGPCPKTCPGVEVIHSGNIDKFKDCTVIEGSIAILDQSFKGFQHVFANYSFGQRYEQMAPERLNIFKTLKEVTGNINIQAYHKDFTDLSYFENLETIGGRSLTEMFASLYIVKSSLVSLDLRSLKLINAGAVVILENKNLCFVEDINWYKIKRSLNHELRIDNNRNRTTCIASGLKCDPQCSKDGCWGPGPDQCISCANFRLENNTCLQNCKVMAGFYEHSSTLCKPCHYQCGSTCHGPGPEKCDSCRYVRDGNFCTDTCPITKYEYNRECRSCHENCVDGCTGPENKIGSNGCNSCDKTILNEDGSFEKCLQKNESCPDGYYFEYVLPQEQASSKTIAGIGICRKCHPRCKKCTGYGFHEQVCKECMNYKRGEQCEDECPTDHFADEETQICNPCHSECRECVGPGPENCLSCQNYKTYLEGNPGDNITLFRCVSTCPPELPHKIFSQENSEPYCSDQIGTPYPLETNQKTAAILIGVFLVCIILVVFLGIVVYQYCRKVKVKEEQVKMTMALTGLEDNEPLRPTNVKPNMTKLIMVKESEMRKGGILGFGAFGTVYKGVWIPEGENMKIPVAIKVLREGTGASSSKEFLEEAYIMATVEHPNLLQLLAVCMTSQMMLITQLMPLGCLLDFVRTNREKIGSKALLNWSTQIAKGMAYLEEKRLVHRDLAARNVLVQTPNLVKITDFGLAKLLDINEDEYKAAGGKMPIKWLALECIQHRIFTHKSDVWAFGVTVWELLTYGGRPYENVSARDVPELLEKGERLPQPNICTIEVYMIMIKCWMLDAESRPGFTELADEFAKMARDPGRYLVIPGDKFMRLPTYSVQANKDEKEIIRGIASNQDSVDSQFEGEQYLQPKSRQPIAYPQHGMTLSSITSGTSMWPPGSSVSMMTSDGSCAPQNQHNWNQELLRCAAASDVAPSDITNSDTHSSVYSNTRYSSDPLKMIGGKEYDISCDSSKSQAQVGALKLDLPLDEDDYLLPTPQQNQPATAYVDLIGDSKHTDGISGYRMYPDFLPPHAGQTNIDNPEYLLSQDSASPIPSQTIGIPCPSESLQIGPVATPSPEGSSVVSAAGQPVYHPQRSSEEESDHEYYNDFDRLRRELQPLKKSETAV